MPKYSRFEKYKAVRNSIVMAEKPVIKNDLLTQFEKRINDINPDILTAHTSSLMSTNNPILMYPADDHSSDNHISEKKNSSTEHTADDSSYADSSADDNNYEPNILSASANKEAESYAAKKTEQIADEVQTLLYNINHSSGNKQAYYIKSIYDTHKLHQQILDYEDELYSLQSKLQKTQTSMNLILWLLIISLIIILATLTYMIVHR